MNILDLSISQLKRATAIKEQIEVLNDELRRILSETAVSSSLTKKKTPTTGAFRRQRPAAGGSARVSVKARKAKKRRTMGSAARAKLSAKMKAYWAAKRAGKK